MQNPPYAVSSVCKSGQNLPSVMHPEVRVTQGSVMPRQMQILTFHFSHLSVATRVSVLTKGLFTKGKDISSISGLLPVLDRMVNIFGRDVNLKASGKKPSGTRWQRGGNSPYGQVLHSILISIWYLPLEQTIYGPAFWSSLPVSLFLLLLGFLPIQNKFCQIIFLTHIWIQNLKSLLFG